MATRLLLVDDNPQDRLLAKRAVSALLPDVEIVEVKTQPELDDVLSGPPFDVVVTDYQLRWTDGLKVLEAVHNVAPDTPVVMFTNTGSEEVAASGLRLGLADYIIKTPKTFDRLAHGVVTALHNADVQRREREVIVREREARRVAEDASRMKDEFLATISHELRTPLNAIRGWVQIIQTPHDGNTMSRALSALERNTATLSRLIEDLVDESAIASGRLRLRIQPTDFHAVVSSVIDSIQPASSANGITVTLTAMPGLEPVAADRERLHQIVWNLLSNAVKFTARGGHVTATLARSGSKVELVVTDTGRGIRADYIDRVFERFSQEDGGTTRKHGGMGLGLSIVRHLVEMHGGTIAVSSPGEGRGATFTVRIPIAAVREGHQPDDTRGKRLVGVRVLIVDNDREAREVLAQILKDAGALVSLATSAADGFGQLMAELPDVLVCDIGMPHEDGYSFIRRVRGDSQHRLASIPAVAVTAYGGDRDRLRALEAGFQFHLAKPVAISDFVGIVGLLANQADESARGA